MNGQQFKFDLHKWAKHVGANLDALASQCSQEMAERVVVATPVDTGNLRGNWQPSIGEEAPAASGSAQKYGVSEISTVAAGVKAGDRFFMLNNTVYARRIELGFVGKDALGRMYNQKGRYFISDTVKRWRSVVSKVAASLKMS